MSEAQMKGSEILARCLEQQNVEMIFAYPGIQAIELLQALTDSKIRVVQPRHEQGGAFAAGGYARATGKVGVCLAGGGSGATNLVSGIADAYMDSVPTVFITGQVPARAIGKNGFQEIDIIGMTRPIVKHSLLVLDAAEIPAAVKEAFHLASTGRPGPVVIDLPTDVQSQLCTPDFNRPIRLAHYTPAPKLSETAIEQIRELLAASEKPCVCVGGGVIAANAAEELKQFAETHELPVVSTLMGIGALPESHHLSMSWLGMHGAVYANYAVNECDLLLVLGARFDDRATGDPAKFAPRCKIVHIDIDESEINKNKPADIGLVADVKEVLTALNAKPTVKDRTAWLARLNECKQQNPRHYKHNPQLLQPQYVLKQISRATGGEALVVTGVGQHQMWAAQYYDFRFPRQFLTSGGLGAMGFGLPAAIGAKLARPDQVVLNIDGDGGFQMNIQELATLKTAKAGVKTVILNNQSLGMIAQWEDRFFDGRHGNTFFPADGNGEPYPDFAAIAKGYGIKARTVSERGELADALTEMLADDEPYVLDVRVSGTEHVLPMIPPGGDCSEAITE